MTSSRLIPVVLILVTGCFPHYVPVRGEWSGEAVRLKVYDRDGRWYETVRLIVDPEAVPDIKVEGLTTTFDPSRMPPEQRQKWEWARRSPVLVNSDLRVIDASQVHPGDQLRVRGTWPAERVRAERSAAYTSWPIEEGTKVRLGLITGAIFNISRGMKVEVRPAAPLTVPAPTTCTTQQSAAITLHAKLASVDQIDLSWTAFPGVVTYRVELSEDGVDYHESLEVEGSATSASLVGFEEARSGRDHYLRVVAFDAKGRTVAVSNVCVITSPP